MSRYIIRIGEVLAETIERANRAQPEQLAGYIANLEFWIEEFEHVQLVEQGFELRNDKFKKAYESYVSEYGASSNKDECGVPYQGAYKSTRGHRDIIKRCRNALDRFVDRAVAFGMIDISIAWVCYDKLGKC